MCDCLSHPLGGIPPRLNLCLTHLRISCNTQHGTLVKGELSHASYVPLTLSFEHKVQSLSSRNLLEGGKAKTHITLHRGENSIKTCSVKKCFLVDGEFLEGPDGPIGEGDYEGVFLEDEKCW